MTAFSLTHWQQSDRALVLTTQLGADVLLAERMVLRESLFGLAADSRPPLALQDKADWGAMESSGLDAGNTQWLHAHADQPPRAGYCLHLTALSSDAHIDLVSMIGQPLLLEWQTDADRSTLRPLHGHITAAQLLAVNGGFARYGFVVEPALAWLAQRCDSWVFQGKNILDIVQEVITETAGTGAMTVREALDKRDLYQQQSQLIQQQQSDLEFVHELLLSNGLTYLFEHQADPGGATLGSHTLVITDQQAIGVQLGDLRFHRGDATEAQDTIQRWQPQHQIAPLAYSAQSWDYATLDTRPVMVSHDPQLSQDNELAAIAALLTVEDDPGQYSWFNSEDGQRYATLAQQAFDAHMQTGFGAGTVRSLTPSAHFTLSQRAGSWGSFDAPATDPMAKNDNSVRVLAVTHSARNNFDAEFSRSVQQALGGGVQHAEGAAPAADAARNNTSDAPLHPQGAGRGSKDAEASRTPLYSNVFTMVPASAEWRPMALPTPVGADQSVGAPAPLYASPAPVWSVPVGATRALGVASANQAGRPRAQACTAIVVGVDGSPTDTDRNHRIKIQYHWQRGQTAHNRQSHPSGDSNAPAKSVALDASASLEPRPAPCGCETSSTWARIGTPLAGQNYGAVWIPRIGQEVVVEYAHGDIDRPVIVGAVYNGEGTPDQTGNTQPGGVGAATGNAPLWFNGNGHANHLSGIVT
ncbi:MAG TPA: type VI secretion system Vgr family protein, partial [Thiobacillus sp.]